MPANLFWRRDSEGNPAEAVSYTSREIPVFAAFAAYTDLCGRAGSILSESWPLKGLRNVSQSRSGK